MPAFSATGLRVKGESRAGRSCSPARRAFAILESRTEGESRGCTRGVTTVPTRRRLRRPGRSESLSCPVLRSIRGGNESCRPRQPDGGITMKNASSARTFGTLCGVLLGLSSSLATAQVRNEYGEIQQTVARISYLSGEVSFARGDDPDDWQAGDRNVP